MNYGICINIDGTLTGGFESQSDENLILSKKNIMMENGIM